MSFDPEISEWGNPPSKTGTPRFRPRKSFGSTRFRLRISSFHMKVFNPEYIGVKS